eukprot:gene8630-13345_t
MSSAKKNDRTIDETIKLTQLKDFIKDETVEALKHPEGTKKILCLDGSVTGALMSVLDSTDLSNTLKPLGVVDIQLLNHEKLKVDINSPKSVVYVVRSDMTAVKMLGRRIKDDIASSRAVYVHMVPKTTEVCLRILDEYGVRSNIRELNSLELDLIPLEYDFMTMELDTCFREMTLDGDTTTLAHIARSLMKFQAFFGHIPIVRGKGRFAEKVATMMQRMGSEVSDSSKSLAPEVEALYIFDREVDCLTPVLFQQTYEGLIDEFYGIRHQLFTPPFDVSTEDPQLNGKTHLLTAEKDHVFTMLRGSHLKTLAADVQRATQEVKKQMDERNHLDKLGDIREFMGRLPSITEQKAKLAVHISIAVQVNRMANSREYKALLEHQKNMIDCQREKEVSDFIEECICKDNPLPKVLRLVCMFSMTFGLSPTKNAMEGIFNQYPGPTFGTPDLPDDIISSQSRVIMLFFLGGITYGELAALRWVK